MKFFTLTLIALTLLCVGCSKDVSVSGTVKYEDGRPLKQGTIMFSTPTYVGSAPIQPDGTYTVSGSKVDSGIPRGEYKVCVAASTSTSEDTPGWERGVSMVDAKFSDPENSGLTVKIDGATIYNITVEYPKTGRIKEK
ncbi:MAG: hypothetical protein LBT09_15050 [Planctomycetaceae bacterium]|jgi:hypothetical protein|nr:hypothetical protein [Planctomycetaceae bacterium]